MPVVSPCNHRLVKQVNRSLLIAVTYSNVEAHPNLLDVTVEFVNTKTPISTPNGGNDTHGAEHKNGDHNGSHTADSGWFKGFWPGEKAPLAPLPLPEVPLFLGYVQMVGYVRVNRKIGGNGTLDAGTDVFWKNPEYLTRHSVKDDGIYDEIEETPFIKDHGTATPRKGRIEGISDLHARRFDQTAVYLLHDMAHPFNTMEMPGNQTPPIPEPHHAALASDLKQSIAPFYVTAQHLLFSSVKLAESQNEVFKIRVPKPSDALPPSYNTKLTGSAGDGGAVSICYLFVVGVLEQSEDSMKQRAVYFPLELKPGQKGWDREWLQRNYLQDTLVDQEWTSQSDSAAKGAPNGDVPARFNGSSGRSEKRFVRDLDTLIESSIHVVAANERRKSSVSLLGHDSTGLLQQVPQKLKVLYQIRVNNQTLCTLTLSKPYFHVGDDIHFFLELHTDSLISTRVVGVTSHVEAHEVFHLESETQRKAVNFYKVTPTVKLNAFADAMADAYSKTGSGVVASSVNLPGFLTQQFQASTFMDLKYFLVCRFVLVEFSALDTPANIDDQPTKYTDYIQEYKLENESSEFKFLIPVTVLP